MPDPLQIVVILDVAQVQDDEVLPMLPDKRRPCEVVRLSTQSGLRPTAPGAMKGPYDWDRLGRTVEAIAEQVRTLGEKAGGSVVLYVAGRAPLPLFVQLGYSLTKFGGDTKVVNEAIEDVRVLNPYRGGQWTEYSTAAAPPGGPCFFDRIAGLEPSEATGRTCVYVSTIGAPAPKEAFFETLRKAGRAMAGVVEIRTVAAGDVTAENAAQVAGELVRELPRIKDTYARAEGIALFVAGPVPLAFMVGQALNKHAQREVWVMNYDRGGPGVDPGYEVAVSLPFQTKAPVLTDTAEDKLARRDALDAMIDGVEELRNTLAKEDFPAAHGAGPARRHLAFLKDLRFERDAEGDAFGLRIAQRRMSVGRGLLAALVGAERETIRRFAQQLVLHELHHDGQDLRTSNYAEIGRAGFALEEIDFWADTFALDTLIAWDLRRGGPRAQARVAEVAAGWIDTALFGIEVFDRFEQGARLDRLYERRLRRYLIWHLQFERAGTLRSADDARDLLRDRLFVELAPVEGVLDPRGDKIVTGAIAGRTEVFAVLQGHLIRRGPRPGFDPSELIEAVRLFDRERIRRVLRVLVEEERSVLAGWTDLGL